MRTLTFSGGGGRKGCRVFQKVQEKNTVKIYPVFLILTPDLRNITEKYIIFEPFKNTLNYWGKKDFFCFTRLVDQLRKQHASGRATWGLSGPLQVLGALSFPARVGRHFPRPSEVGGIIRHMGCLSTA